MKRPLSSPAGIATPVPWPSTRPRSASSPLCSPTAAPRARPTSPPPRPTPPRSPARAPPGGAADVAAIGGMPANNASGNYSVKYGGTRDHVRAATIVTGTGELLRLGNLARKSASGYHLLGLVVGSEGTLAIATELTLALAGLPQARRQGGFRFRDAGAAARATAELIRFGVDVAAVEFLDARTVAALNRFGSFG